MVRAGLLVPDIPFEETAAVREVARMHDLELVLLTTPTTALKRATAIAQATQGFLYLVSVAGLPPPGLFYCTCRNLSGLNSHPAKSARPSICCLSTSTPETILS